MLVLLATLVCWFRLLIQLADLLVGLVPALCLIPLHLRKRNRSQRQIPMAVRDGEAPKLHQKVPNIELPNVTSEIRKIELEHANLACYSCLLVLLTAPSGKSPWQWGAEKLQNCTKKVPNITSETRKAEHASLACCSCLLVSLVDLACWSLICLSALFLHYV